ncbi:hypothetical protein BSFA1_80860 (plasmid) [Burkholderia sp. SFA1]|nr:hypothetical protein BSFA1_80860 [Burkholderia sp. SFA1]
MFCFEDGTTSVRPPQWPRDRMESGFFTEIDTARAGETFVLPGRESIIVSHQISANYMAPDLHTEAMGFRATAFRRDDSLPVAYVEFDVIRAKSGCNVDDESFVNACDTVNGTLSALANAVLESSIHGIHTVFARGPLLHLSRLEVRGDCAGHGVGALLGLTALQWLQRETKAVLLLLQPFPLQFESCAPSHDSPDRAKFEASYAEAESRLTKFYEQTFGVQCARPGEAYLMAALGGFELAVDDYGWSLCHPEEEGIDGK